MSKDERICRTCKQGYYRYLDDMTFCKLKLADQQPEDTCEEWESAE